MNEAAFHGEGVWFVYDGECPICRHAAASLKIKEKYGRLHLIDARQHQDHPLLNAINRHGYDLDKGMVIHHDGVFYHGTDALIFMGRHGKAQGAFNIVNIMFFRQRILARLFYPPLKALRRFLLKRRGTPPLHNLHKN